MRKAKSLKKAPYFEAALELKVHNCGWDNPTSNKGRKCNEKYDAYVSVREDSNTLLQAWYTIADSDGKAKVTWMWDPGYPFLVAALERSKKIITECSGCKAEEVGLREFASAANPVRMQELGAGLLSRNPDAEYVLTAYGLNSHSIALAAKAMGRNVKVVAKNADPNNVAFVSQGELQAEVGASSNWGGWAAVDQMVRLLAGQPPLDIMEENQPEHIFPTKAHWRCGLGSRRPARGDPLHY